MRLNKYIAQSTGMSRRAADSAIADGRVTVNGSAPTAGQQVLPTASVTLDGRAITPSVNTHTILLNKPIGYICSRNGQGSRTIYELLPPDLRALKPVGRLDKDSSGLLLLTNDGDLAHRLTHPSFQKIKRYDITLDKPLAPLHRQMISDHGIELADGNSRLIIERPDFIPRHITVKDPEHFWHVSMREGRNRQIRRTFEALGYTVQRLHRTHFGTYELKHTQTGKYREV